jgi:hypothetical protein
MNQRILQATTAWRITFLSCILFWLIFIAVIAHSEDAPAPPKASFGVIQCGKMVALWIVTQDGQPCGIST